MSAAATTDLLTITVSKTRFSRWHDIVCPSSSFLRVSKCVLMKQETILCGRCTSQVCCQSEICRPCSRYSPPLQLQLNSAVRFSDQCCCIIQGNNIMQVLNLPRGEAVGTMLSNSLSLSLSLSIYIYIYRVYRVLIKSQTIARIQEPSKKSWWLGKSNAKGKQQ